MNYVFQFGIVWDHFDQLLAGAATTVELSVAGFCIGLALAAVLAFLRDLGQPLLRRVIELYVEAIRNTPFLVQLFLFYFSLPALGIRFDAVTAALIVMSINFSGYTVEILRAGIASIPPGQVQAGDALGLTRLQSFRHIIFVPALRAAYPALASQFVLLLLGSSLISSISVEELTGITNTLQSTTFRSFEFYFVATAIYLVMALLLRGLLHLIYWLVFVRPYQRGATS